jgi:hypothetical protein
MRKYAFAIIIVALGGFAAIRPMPPRAPMGYIERAVLDPMGLRLFANTPTTEAPSIAPAAPTEQAVALTALRSCADHTRSIGPSAVWLPEGEAL